MNTSKDYNPNEEFNRLEEQLLDLQRCAKKPLLAAGIMWTFGGKLNFEGRRAGEVHLTDLVPELEFLDSISDEEAERISGIFYSVLDETLAKIGDELAAQKIVGNMRGNEFEEGVGIDLVAIWNDIKSAIKGVRDAVEGLAGELFPGFGDMDPELAPIPVSENERAVAEGE